MTHDQIDRMLRNANPVPNLSVLEADPALSLLPQSEWRKDMTSDTSVEVDREPAGRKRGWLVAAAAAAIVLVGGLIITRPWSQVPTAGESAVETANAYLDAYWSFDADTALEYMAPELVQAEDGAEAFRSKIRQYEAWHYRWSGHHCEVSSEDDSGVTVICPFDYYALGSDQIGLEPFSGDAEVLRIVDGVIVELTLDDHTYNEFSTEMWDPMKAWVLGEHPDDYDTLYGDDSWLTDESIARWDQLVEGYVEYVNSSG